MELFKKRTRSFKKATVDFSFKIVYTFYNPRKSKPEVRVYMNFEIGQKIKMKKPHPCGSNNWEILRVGMDFRLKCNGCGHQIMVPRKTVEKGFRGFIQ